MVMLGWPDVFKQFTEMSCHEAIMTKDSIVSSTFY